MNLLYRLAVLVTAPFTLVAALWSRLRKDR